MEGREGRREGSSRREVSFRTRRRFVHNFPAHSVVTIKEIPSLLILMPSIPSPPSLTISPNFSFRVIPSFKAFFVGSAKSLASSKSALPSARSTCRALNLSSGFFEAMNFWKFS